MRTVVYVKDGVGTFDAMGARIPVEYGKVIKVDDGYYERHMKGNADFMDKDRWDDWQASKKNKGKKKPKGGSK